MFEIIGTPLVFTIILAILAAAITWPINVALYRRSTGYDYCILVENANRQALSIAVDYISLGQSSDISDAILENIISAACIENKAYRCDAYDLSQLKSVLVHIFIHNNLIGADFKQDVITKLCENNAPSTHEKYFPTRSIVMARRMASIMTAVCVLLTIVTATVVSYAFQGVLYLRDENTTILLVAAIIVCLLIAEWLMYLAMRPTEKNHRESKVLSSMTGAGGVISQPADKL